MKKIPRFLLQYVQLRLDGRQPHHLPTSSSHLLCVEWTAEDSKHSQQYEEDQNQLHVTFVHNS